MKVTVYLSKDGDFKVHRAGCADLKRGEATYGDPFDLEVESDLELAQELWGEAAADRFRDGTPEHLGLTLEYHESSTHLFPCIKNLPLG